MITLEAQPEVHAIEQQRRPAYATCHECRRSFRPKSEDQPSLELCDPGFEKPHHGYEPVVSVHVKVLPRRKAGISQYPRSFRGVTAHKYVLTRCCNRAF